MAPHRRRDVLKGRGLGHAQHLVGRQPQPLDVAVTPAAGEPAIYVSTSVANPRPGHSTWSHHTTGANGRNVLTVDPADADFALGECPSGSEERAATRPASREGRAPSCASPDRLHHT